MSRSSPDFSAISFSRSIQLGGLRLLRIFDFIWWRVLTARGYTTRFVSCQGFAVGNTGEAGRTRDIAASPAWWAPWRPGGILGLETPERTLAGYGVLHLPDPAGPHFGRLIGLPEAAWPRWPSWTGWGWRRPGRAGTCSASCKKQGTGSKENGVTL